MAGGRIYVALLRGINVGGTTSVAMADLRRVFVDLGLQDVTTYLRSGNVAFGSAAKPARLVADLERAITDGLGRSVTVILRSKDELEAMAADNPFLGQQDDPTKLHVTFLAAKPDAAHRARLDRPAGETGEFVLADRDVFLHCPDGYGRSKLSNAFIEKRLGVAATTRNWKSVLKLRDLAGS